MAKYSWTYSIFTTMRRPHGGYGVAGTSVVSETPISDVRLPATVALAAIGVLGYMVSSARRGKTEFTVINAMILAVVIAIIGAVAIPLLEMASGNAKSTAVLQNLRTLRSQIELYKLEHGGEPPMLYQGTFPQLIRPTNTQGIPGDPGAKYPYGPYLQSGLPVNPFTGSSIVTLTDTFPPKEPSGNGGWLYHQQTGRIAADLADFLGR